MPGTVGIVLPARCSLKLFVSGSDAPEVEERCFAHSMPLGDLDHSLHLAMKECEQGFEDAAGEAWTLFDHQVAALSKFFSKRDCVELYTAQHIHNNPRIPNSAKKSLAAVFDCMCPTFMKHRWHFAFDVLHWISRRQGLRRGHVLVSVACGSLRVYGWDLVGFSLVEGPVALALNFNEL